MLSIFKLFLGFRKNKATASIFFVGVMFGAMSFGSLSDRYGRRIMLLVSYVSGMLFAIASAFSTTYVMFAVLRFFTGFCITGIVIVSQVLSNSSFFGLSLYLTQLTYALIELPCKLSNYYLLDRVGRRSIEVGALLVTGACLGINILIPKGRHPLLS
uniref:Major facilitator superfamily (MFS) profile domain-containing protein n=1 Tax=Acanthochromis polyacanthus TaxID=80966 RepID=A0A3Q1FIF7_9TELE